MEWFADFFEQFVGVKGALWGLAGFLAAVWQNRIKLRDKHFFERKSAELQHQLELAKLEITHKNKESELLLASLADKDRALFEQLIKRRGEIIDENYKLLVALYSACRDTLEPDHFGRKKPDTKDAYEAALPKFDDYKRHFDLNKIYFTKETAEKVSEYLVAVFGALTDARVVYQKDVRFNGGQPAKELQSLFNRIEGELSGAKLTIEDEYRRYLGSQIEPFGITNSPNRSKN
ncbi:MULTISPECIES: hypothetical protein [Chromohalobacter]|uniref:hypothetical protein n=1 Tax=Chromohalobacter TaxID=42054 RepID=UPI001FFD2459|nr:MULTISPECIES: hypothetical protein [Chromohalobacter]MCK2045598.1 hypothetical protein [Chromohalobacter moromii]MCT8468329.1 hypothetical protein [Chromohalobacter canadensis]MCT8471384.1 hypothetical protein [Chromohalobacter canadensis]MCT8498837.1 hypothetical protein [Chromohalobacter canadensis]